MNYKQLLDSITPEIYIGLKTAVEIGKWPDGRKLSTEQRQTCLQAVIAYEAKHLPEEKRTGYVPITKPSDCENKNKVANVNGEIPLKWH